ncbi:MAG: hypothetical protein CMP96_01120, partial [Gammaproteobacteria bacterium]|nr:hypothetical protein [Gammaproteobacteria bacterium]
ALARQASAGVTPTISGAAPFLIPRPQGTDRPINLPVRWLGIVEARILNHLVAIGISRDRSIGIAPI